MLISGLAFVLYMLRLSGSNVFWKNLHVNIRGIKHNFENSKALLEDVSLFQYDMCLRNLVVNHRTPKQFKFFAGFIYVPYEKSKNSRGGGVLIFIKKKSFLQNLKRPF